MQDNDLGMETSYSDKQFEFTGKAMEFFSIWIVNVALTILTLGIYSAWAKVRTHQYFYGNTKLDDATFRYLADPKQILKGRIIALVFFMAYYFSSLISPIAAGIIFVIILLLVPALIVMSMSFRLRNSAYRNVKFDFNKNFKRAYLIFSMPVVMIGTYVFIVSQFQPEVAAGSNENPALSILIGVSPLLIMFLMPWWEFLITQFKVLNSKYGDAALAFQATTKDYFKMYALVILMPMLALVLIAIIASIIIPMTGMGEINPLDFSGLTVMAVPIVLVIILFYIWVFAFIQTKRTNLVFNNINLNGHQLNSELKVGYMMYLYFTNTLAMALTLGLMMPWAKIRTAKYKASVTSLTPAGNLGEFASMQQQNQSAIGEEIGEMFDMDLGF